MCVCVCVCECTYVFIYVCVIFLNSWQSGLDYKLKDLS